jgi:hypothetical protein
LVDALDSKSHKQQKHSSTHPYTIPQYTTKNPCKYRVHSNLVINNH